MTVLDIIELIDENTNVYLYDLAGRVLEEYNGKESFSGKYNNYLVHNIKWEATGIEIFISKFIKVVDTI